MKGTGVTTEWINWFHSPSFLDTNSLVLVGFGIKGDDEFNLIPRSELVAFVDITLVEEYTDLLSIGVVHNESILQGERPSKTLQYYTQYSSCSNGETLSYEATIQDAY